jgi:hypothetical protein
MDHRRDYFATFWGDAVHKYGDIGLEQAQD